MSLDCSKTLHTSQVHFLDWDECIWTTAGHPYVQIWRLLLEQTFPSQRTLRLFRVSSHGIINPWSFGSAGTVLCLRYFITKNWCQLLLNYYFLLSFCCHITLIIKVAVFIYKKNPYHGKHRNVLKVLSCWKNASRQGCGWRTREPLSWKCSNSPLITLMQTSYTEERMRLTPQSH